MTLLRLERARLIVIDFQTRLMPAIHEGARLVGNAQRLVKAATLLKTPVLVTEQNPKGLGGTVPELADAGPVVTKMSFDACAEPAFLDALQADEELIVCGCEAHVCVGQTVLGLLARRRRVFVVRDAIGARSAENKEAAILRMAGHGAEIITTEMVVFEWLRTSEHPQFRTIAGLIK
ncbi:MAG: isochorismatase family protein [Hyphomonadaceae bacterium]